MSRSIQTILLGGLIAWLLAACNLDPWTTGSGPRRLDAGPPPDALGLDVTPDACVAATEICDGMDNDCDGEVDEDFDLQSDPANCGSCGNLCAFPHGIAGCAGGACVLEDCFPGYHDTDGDPANGCEYQCLITNDGSELCDGRDNDCDGAIDEDFDLQNDPENCGACANVCVFLNGNGACDHGTCTLGSCRGGFVDLDGNVQNGCECQMDLTEDATGLPTCVEGQGSCGAGEICADLDRDGQAHCSPIPLDLCDGRDNDCDGQVDEDATALLPTTACYSFASGCTETAPGVFACNGPCHPGTLSCVNGQLLCSGQAGPQVESCNDVDDDCNGVVDDNWDKQNDPANCGSCGHDCGPLLPNAVPRCANGGCEIAACLPGYFDLDPGVPGCEYPCTLTAGGVERCGDGLDNDCDGQVDEGFDLQTDPENCGDCGYSCQVERPRGAQVVSAGPVCVAGVCQYECQPDSWDLDGDLAQGGAGNGCEYYCQPSNGGVEACDGQDNDCDGQVDEGFDLQNHPANCGGCGNDCSASVPPGSSLVGCTSGRCVYACQAGFVDRNGDLGVPGSDGCECAIGPERCDGVDNDCNGVVDDASAIGCTTFYRDVDGDTYGDTADATCLCGPDAVQRYTAVQDGDCVDNNVNVHPGATEVCDGQDNDCDGFADNAVVGQASPLLSRACYTGPGGTDGVGICHGSTQTCDSAAGGWPAQCPGEQTPEAEVCDTVDNNCDGQVDEVFDFQNDASNCGGCGIVCSIPNAVAKCSGGTCVVDSCIPPYYNYDADPTDCEYYCVLQGAPVCGSTGDADCNGQPDNTQFDTDTDPFNCGTCGTVCAANAPFGMEVDTSGGTGCTGGTCQYRCATGFVNLDGNPGNGCECVITQGGVEVCDNEDNDCDGLVDEGIDKQTDPDNCGSCGNRCADLGDAAALAAAHVTFAGCTSGQCTFDCEAGYYDLNNDRNSGRPFGTNPGDSDGCEYACVPTSPSTEVCDGVDNDCDGFTDRDSAGQVLTQTCYEGPSGTQGVGECRDGVATCTGGGWSACVGQVLPSQPVCGSNQDNDCDGQADALQFDTDTDPFHCGGCGNSCYAAIPPNMIPDPAGACVGGTCQYVCLNGYRDLANGLADGCEYACPVVPPLADGTEDCNGLDDDCDGQVDESPDLLNTKPTPDAHCSYPRVGGTPCDGVQVVCSNGPGGAYPMGWYCNWTDPAIQYDPNRPNVVLAEESRCDDADNDCDGLVDEVYTLKGTACDDGDLGACKGTGTYQCTADETAVECVITDPGANPTAELCNNVDDDCDGLVDESKATPGADPSYVVDDMVPVLVGGVTVWVYTYEASRPDAAAGDAGTATHRACSNPGVLPWANVSYAEAKAACEAAGYRLCTEAEWQGACEGGDGFSDVYPYYSQGYTSYQPLLCNGNDFDTDCTGLDDDDVIATGRVYSDCTTPPSECVSRDGIFDLSGNLMEWTSTLAAGYSDVYHVRGGSFLTHEWGLTCQADFITLQADFRYDDLGFRCCSDTAP